MWFLNWLKGLFAHPRTTASGIVSLATGGLAVAGMVTGKLPVSAESITVAATGISTGIGLIAASDGGKQVAQAVQGAGEIAAEVKTALEQGKE